MHTLHIQAHAKEIPFFIFSCNRCYRCLCSFCSRNERTNGFTLNRFLLIRLRFYYAIFFLPKVSNLLLGSRIDASNKIYNTHTYIYIFNTSPMWKHKWLLPTEYIAARKQSTVIWQWVIALNSNAFNSYVNATKRCTYL